MSQFQIFTDPTVEPWVFSTSCTFVAIGVLNLWRPWPPIVRVEVRHGKHALVSTECIFRPTGGRGTVGEQARRGVDT